MTNKQRLLAIVPFGLFGIIIFIVINLNLLDSRIAVPLMLSCLGSQHLFIGLRFFKDDRKMKKFYILFGIGCFASALFLVLNSLRLV